MTVEDNPILPTRVGLLLLLSLFFHADADADSSGAALRFTSRHRLVSGATVDFDRKSGGARSAFGYAWEFRSTRSRGFAAETVLHRFGPDSERALFLLVLKAEQRLPPIRGTVPFLETGGGLFRWGGKEGCGGWVCLPFSGRNRHDSFGGFFGGGVHCAIRGNRSVTFGARFHPRSTYDGSRSFLHALAALGW